MAQVGAAAVQQSAMYQPGGYATTFTPAGGQGPTAGGAANPYAAWQSQGGWQQQQWQQGQQQQAWQGQQGAWGQQQGVWGQPAAGAGGAAGAAGAGGAAGAAGAVGAAGAAVAAAGTWQAVVDPATTKTYYYNSATQESRWEPPPGFGQPVAAVTPGAADSDTVTKIMDVGGYGVWEKLVEASSGKSYWTNHQLQRTQWDKPAGTPVLDHAPAQPRAAAGAWPTQPGAQPHAAAGAWPTQPGAQPQAAAGAWPMQPGAQPQAAAGAWPMQAGAWGGQGGQGGQQWGAQHQQQPQQQGAWGGGQQQQQQQGAWGQQQAQQPGEGGYNSASKPHSFAWKPNQPKPQPQQPAFQWSDGREETDKNRNFPPLGSSGEHKDIRQPLQHGQGERREEVRSWHQQNNASGGGGGYGNGVGGQGNGLSGHGGQEGGGDGNVHSAWPPKLQEFVSRCFQQCNTNESRVAMQDSLKGIIEGAKRNHTLWKTDWDIQPLPRPLGSEPNTPNRHSRQQQQQQQLMDKRSKKNGKRGREKFFGAEEENGSESLAERQARDRRNARFADMQQGLVNSGAISGGNTEDEIKFISSEAIVGTCMVMEKMFIRIQAMPNPDTVRPEKVLVKWAERLQVKYDTDEADYEWICDQYKAIRQDMVIQHIRNANTISVYEASARIALLEDDLGEFYKIQSYLMHLYKDVPDSCAGQTEFLAYRIFYWVVYNNSADLMKEIKFMTQEQKKDPNVKHALAVHQAVELSDYDTFFRLFAKTPNLGKCIAKHIRDKMRDRALRVVLRSYKPSIPLDILMRRLGFKSSEDSLDSLLGPQDSQADDDEGAWDQFVEEAKIVVLEDDSTSVDTKATLDALSSATSV